MPFRRLRSAWGSSLLALALAAAGISCGGEKITAPSGTGTGTGTGPTPTAESKVPAQVVIAPGSATLVTGEGASLAVLVKNAAGTILTGQAITWASSDATVATVAAGLVIGKAPGTAVITAKAGDITGTASIAVTPPSVASIIVGPSPDTIVVGRTAQLTATAKDVTGTTLAGRTAVWSSTDSTIASVTSAGIVFARAAGTTTVGATIEGKRATATIVVRAVPVATIAVTPATTTIYLGGTFSLSAETKDADGVVVDGRSVSWVSSDTSVATVSASGVVTANKLGSAVVTAMSDGRSSSAAVVVKSVPVSTVAASPATIDLYLNSTLQLSAAPQDSVGNQLAGRTVTWSVADVSVATISATGLVTAKKVGGTTVKATSEGKTVSVPVNVSNVPVSQLAVTSTTNSIIVGRTITLTAAAKDAAGAALVGRSVAWTSSDSSRASVSGGGVVTGRVAGNVTITATSEGKSSSADLVVRVAPVNAIAATPASASLVVNSTLQYFAVVKDSLGATVADRAVSWSSGDLSVATISATGLLTARAVGKTSVTATSEGKSITVPVAVSAMPVASIAINNGPGSMLLGATMLLNAVTSDANATVLDGRTITWVSSDGTVAAVTTIGQVTTKKVGITKITATSEGKSATVTITVLPLPVYTVTLNTPLVTVAVATTSQLVASLKDSTGTTVTGRFTVWSSADSSIATVTNTGLVTGKFPGATTVTATSEGRSASVPVSVTVPVAAVVVTPNPLTLILGNSAQLAASPNDSVGGALAGRTVTWTSTDATIATVTTLGLVTAKKVGTANLTVACEGKTTVVRVTVTTIPVYSVIASPTAVTLLGGATGQITTTLKDSLGTVLTGRYVVWSSADTTIATVSNAGLITARSPGAVAVTATSEGHSATVTVTVPPPVAAVVVTPSPLSMIVGATAQLTAVTNDSTGSTLTGRTVTWTSSDQTVLTVSTIGILTAKKVGSSVVTAASEGKSTTVAVTVVPVPVSTVTLTPTTLAVDVGATSQLTAALKDSTGAALVGRVIVWSANDTSIATVSAAGLVKGKVAGITTVTATSEGKSGSVTVTVSVPPVVTACSAAGAIPATLAVGEVVTFTGTSKSCLSGTALGAEFAVVAFNSASDGNVRLSGSVMARGVGAAPSSLRFAPDDVLGAMRATLRDEPVASGPVLDESFHVRLQERVQRETAGLVAGARQTIRGAVSPAPTGALSRYTGPLARSVIANTLVAGDTLTLNVSGSGAPCTNTLMRGMRVKAVGTRSIVLADTLNPFSGFSDADYARFAARFDTLVYPLDTAAFGLPSDMDANGRVAVVFTKAVNELTAGGSAKMVGGYFSSRDLFPKTSLSGNCPGSNEGEMIYMLVPDPTGLVNGNVRTIGFVDSLTTGVLAHELQHLINASRRLYVNNAPSVSESVWLNEGLSHIAEELLYYRETGQQPRQKFGDAAVRTNTPTLYPVFQRDASPNFARLLPYLRDPTGNSPIADDDSLATRGAIWSFLRYVADRNGVADGTIWSRFDNATTTGMATLSAVLGTDPIALLRDWTVANYMDDTGLTLPARYLHASWNFRDIYQNTYAGIPSFPIQLTGLAEGVSNSVAVRGGSAGYLRLAVPTNGEALLTFSAPSMPTSGNGGLQFVVVRTR